MKLQQGMTALVTGGVSGLGEASAIALLERGLNVVAVDLNDERGQAMEQKYAGRLRNLTDRTRLEAAPPRRNPSPRRRARRPDRGGTPASNRGRP